MRKWNWNESRMQCKFYWQIGKHFFFLNFFLFFFNSFFWLTHELNLALFKLVFFLLTLCGAFRIWKFCDFACIFFMFSFDFTVILFFFFLFSVFFFVCFKLVLSSVGKFWISDSSEADSISDFRFDFNWIYFLIRFKELFAFDFDLGLASIRFANKFGFFFFCFSFLFLLFAGCSGEFSEFCFCTEWDELSLSFEFWIDFGFWFEFEFRFVRLDLVFDLI